MPGVYPRVISPERSAGLLKLAEKLERKYDSLVAAEYVRSVAQVSETMVVPDFRFVFEGDRPSSPAELPTTPTTFLVQKPVWQLRVRFPRRF